jgi:excisionase family DNA binding protein
LTRETCTLEEAADILNTTPETVAQKIKTEGLPAAKVGRAYVLVRVDVIQWVRAQYGREEAWRSTNEARSGGPGCGIAGENLDALLDSETALRRKESTTRLQLVSGTKSKPVDSSPKPSPSGSRPRRGRVRN